MQREDIFRLSAAAPPSEETLRDVSQFIVDELAIKLGTLVEVLDVCIEKSFWVTSTISFGDRTNIAGDFHYGIASLSVRSEGSSTTAVLLRFRNGKRVSEGHKSILTAEFTEAGWSDFLWTDDEFNEWECDSIDEFRVAGR